MSNSSDGQFQQLRFHVYYDDKEIEFKISQYDTVGDLKSELMKYFDVAPSKQILEGWNNNPHGDETILTYCSKTNEINNLIMFYSDIDVGYKREVPPEVINTRSQFQFSETASSDSILHTTENFSDEYASLSFVEKFYNIYDDSVVPLNACSLLDVISSKLLCKNENKSILLLFFYVENSIFSKTFCDFLKNKKVGDIIKDNFYLLGWDLDEDKFQDSLIETLRNTSQLTDLVDLVKSKTSAAFCIVPTNKTFEICSVLQDTVKLDDVLCTFKNIQEYFINAAQNNFMGSREYQQLMFDLLGNRDYDSFESNQLDNLKDKIGYALYGRPVKESGYDEKQIKEITCLFNVILKESDTYSKYKNHVVISFIYNCTEPLPAEKTARAKKYEDYNPYTDIMPIPVFVLRKCKHSNKSCRIIIDHSGRVYESWENYINKNKLSKCVMVLPKDGRYCGNEEGQVSLETYFSPACGLGSKILKGTDIANTTAGLASAGVIAAATLTTLTVAPIALVTAGVVGVGVGAYSIVRSAYTLYDKSKHKESLSFWNSEARGAYINIVAGALGFAGAGANVVVTQLAARGVDIGKVGTNAVNLVGIVNIGASGVGIANSGYDVYVQWWHENQTPSMLTIVQLTSSVLFFGHAVYNYKSANVIIEEAQQKTLQQYQEGLRSNRHRKTFIKLRKETIRRNSNIQKGNSEVIASIRNISDADQVFAALTRSNKSLNKAGIKFASENGKITFNGVPIDIDAVSAMTKKQVTSFLTQIPENLTPTPSEISTVKRGVTDAFSGFGVSELNLNTIVNYAYQLLGNGFLSTKIINIVTNLVSKFILQDKAVKRLLDELFPGLELYMRLLDIVTDFIAREARNLEELFSKWEETGDDKYYNPIFKYIDKSKLTSANRFCQFMQTACDYIMYANNLTENALKDLITFFYNWIADQILKYNERKEREQNRIKESREYANIRCNICSGTYYSHNKKDVEKYKNS